MALVPETHVVHDSLKIIRFESPNYDNLDKEGELKLSAYYEFRDKSIGIGSFADDITMTYKNPNTGVEEEPNGFEICMLHEIGHSVDDKHKIMDGLVGQVGYGAWEVKKTTQQVLDVYSAAAMAELRAAGIAGGATQASAVSEVIKKGLDSETESDPKVFVEAEGRGEDPCERPAELNGNQWAIVKKYVFKAFKASSLQHWRLDPKEIAMGDYFYVRTTNYKWCRYPRTERDAITVRNYQWCTPAEWFAEVYAYCWMYNVPRPDGVGPLIYPWLPPQAAAVP